MYAYIYTNINIIIKLYNKYDKMLLNINKYIQENKNRFNNSEGIP